MPAPVRTAPSMPKVAAAAGAPAEKNSATKFIESAMKFLGQPYLWGGGHGGAFTHPGPVDCSGLVGQAAHLAGISRNLDGVASAQQNMGQHISPVTPANLKPGDLVFMGNPAHHVGIYIGNNQVLHAPHTGDHVKISPLTGYGWDGATRIFDAAGEPVDPKTLPPTPDIPASSGSAGAPSSGGSPGGSSGGASAGAPARSSGGDSASVGPSRPSPSGMSLPSSGSGGGGRPSSSGAVLSPFDWGQWLDELQADGDLSPQEAKELQRRVKAGDRKGALAMLKAKGLSSDKLQKATATLEKAPAMGAAHDKRNDWFISQYGSASNPNEDLPGYDNGNCGPTSLTMVAKAFGKIDPTPGQADSAIEESRRRMGESQDEHDGTSVEGIARSARSYGLDAKVRSDANLDTIQQELSQGRLVIAHVSTYHLNGHRGGGHYTVVTAIQDGKVYLNDPAHKEGPMVVDAGTFMESVNDRGTHAMISIGP